MKHDLDYTLNRCGPVTKGAKMMTEKINAWWFAARDTLPHGDGRQITIGETHSVGGKIEICRNGLHASRTPFDALSYSTGPYLYKVQSWGSVKEEKDKLVSRYRKYVAVRDVTDLLRKFACEQALSVIHLWDAPEIVRKYLESGDETLRAAARDAARVAASDAALDAAWDAARDAAWDAAWDATWEAARVAARVAARDAHLQKAAAHFNEMIDELFREPEQN